MSFLRISAFCFIISLNEIVGTTVNPSLRSVNFDDDHLRIDINKGKVPAEASGRKQSKEFAEGILGGVSGAYAGLHGAVPNVGLFRQGEAETSGRKQFKELADGVLGGLGGAYSGLHGAVPSIDLFRQGDADSTVEEEPSGTKQFNEMADAAVGAAGGAHAGLHGSVPFKTFREGDDDSAVGVMPGRIKHDELHSTLPGLISLYFPELGKSRRTQSADSAVAEGPIDAKVLLPLGSLLSLRSNAAGESHPLIYRRQGDADTLERNSDIPLRLPSEVGEWLSHSTRNRESRVRTPPRPDFDVGVGTSGRKSFKELADASLRGLSGAYAGLHGAVPDRIFREGDAAAREWLSRRRSFKEIADASFGGLAGAYAGLNGFVANGFSRQGDSENIQFTNWEPTAHIKLFNSANGKRWDGRSLIRGLSDAIVGGAIGAWDGLHGYLTRSLYQPTYAEGPRRRNIFKEIAEAAHGSRRHG